MVKVVRARDANELAKVRQVTERETQIRSMTFPVEGSDLLRLRRALLQAGAHLLLFDRLDASRNLVDDVRDSPLTAEIRAAWKRLDAIVDSILKLPVGRPVPALKETETQVPQSEETAKQEVATK